MPQFRRRDMETDANVSQTVSLFGAAPLDLYVTLGQPRRPPAGGQGPALRCGRRRCRRGPRGRSSVQESGWGPQYNGVMHRTLCSAGKEMRKSLREELYREDTVATFDSWHRTKVHLNGQITG